MSGQLTLYFMTVPSPPSHHVSMRAATLLANADVVIGESEFFDELSSFYGQNAEQICFAPGIPAKAFVDELHAVLARHSHDVDAIIVRLLPENRAGRDPDVQEIAAVREFGASYEVVVGEPEVGTGDESETLPLPRRGSLVGIRVVVPRARHQAAPLSDLLLRAGATPILVPVIEIIDPIEIEALSDAVGHMGEYAWVVFTSQNAVEHTTRVLGDRKDLGGVKVAAVGQATAALLERSGWHVDLVPTRATAQSLVELFPPVTDSPRVFFPSADIAGQDLEEGLTSRGYVVDRVVAYQTVYPPVSPYVRHRAHGAEAIIFTSPSTMSGYLESVGRDQCPSTVISIGPSTTERANQLGIRVTNEATMPSLEGVVGALVQSLEGPR